MGSSYTACRYRIRYHWSGISGCLRTTRANCRAAGHGKQGQYPPCESEAQTVYSSNQKGSTARPSVTSCHGPSNQTCCFCTVCCYFILDVPLFWICCFHCHQRLLSLFMSSLDVYVSVESRVQQKLSIHVVNPEETVSTEVEITPEVMLKGTQQSKIQTWRYQTLKHLSYLTVSSWQKRLHHRPRSPQTCLWRAGRRSKLPWRLPHQTHISHNSDKWCKECMRNNAKKLKKLSNNRNHCVVQFCW